MFLNTLKAVFGTKNDREVKKYLKRVAQINALESKYQNLSDDELKAEFGKFKEQILSGEKKESDILNDVFAIVREVGKRTLNMRHFDVQLIGGMVLHDGKIAEMKTGEGKTLVATLPVVLNAMSGKGVHVVTVNDYLAKRDAEQMSTIYNFLGFSVGVILSSQNSDLEHKKAYDCDITYGTNNEFGFDYLRDNMKFSKAEKVQREHHFVIVDEVDSILIDEARTPLIISGPTNRTLDGYIKANEVAKQMQRGEAVLPPAKPEGDFIVDEKNRNILITEAGIAKAEKLFGVENLYSLDNAILAHQLDQALKAHNLFEKDVHYVLRNNEVIIVDEFTGRLSEGRRFSEGQASLEFYANKCNNHKAKVLAECLDEAIGEWLENNKAPSRKVKEDDNRTSHFYLAMYFANHLARQANDMELQSFFKDIALELSSNEEKIRAEFNDAQGVKVDLGGYYKFDDEKANKIMRPSATFNAIIEKIGQR